MKKTLIITFVGLYSLLLLNCFVWARPVQDSGLVPPVRITVIGTSDLHGALNPRKDKVAEKREVGGIDIISAYVEALRAAHPDTILLLDAGDIYSGTLLSAASEGQTVIQFYNDLGYDAAAIGNHDFDFGPIGVHSSAQGPKDDPLGVIKQRISEARFPFLAANIFDRNTNKPVAWKNLHRYVIIERKGIKIGIIGLTSEDTPITTNKDNIKSLEFRPLESTLKEVLVEVRKKGAQVVVVLVHSGVRVDEDTEEVSGPIFNLAKSLSPDDVNLFVCGHEHAPFGRRINGIPVIQPMAKGVAFTRADLVVNPSTGQVLSDQVSIHDNTYFFRNDRDGGRPTYAGRLISPNPHFVKRLKKFQKSVEKLDNMKLGRVAKKLSHRNRLDSEVGNLITDGMRAADKSIDIAMYNRGGVRASIPKGVITYGRIYEVVPFENSIIKVSLTKEQIYEIIRHGIDVRYGVMEVSGIKVSFNPRDAGNDKCISIRTESGEVLKEGKKYTVAVNDFIFKGGDGYTTFEKGTDVQNTHIQVRDSVVTHIKKLGTIEDVKVGRYVIDEQACENQ
jgi:5'-nucleotidase